jgi:hypothetical protein
MAIDPIYIAELAHEGLIKDKTFNNKRIMGPAVLFPDALEIVRGGAHGDVQGALWELPKGKLIQGTIRILRCKFRNCTFENIGWASRDVQELRDQVGWMYDEDPSPPLQGWSPQHN